MSIENTILFGKYQINQVLGTGRSGTVFLAVHLGLEEYRAVKRVPKSYIEYDRFRKEALILKDLRHPGIPIVYDLEEDEEYSYLIEEYLEGESIYDLVHRLGYLSKARMIRYGIQICLIVNHLHSARPNPILYLDLQPKNLLLCQEQIKLIDFDHAASLTDANLSRKRYGTVGCAAPEQYTEEPLDERTDIYAIGVLLHYLGTGTYPDENPGFWQKAWGEELAAVIRTCLQPVKEDRFSSVVCVLERLEKLAGIQTGVFKENQISSLVIALTGSKSGVGTTHISIGLSVYLNNQGHPCLYEERNSSGTALETGSCFGVKPDQRGLLYIRDCILKPFCEEYVKPDRHTYRVIVRDYGTDWAAIRDEEDLDLVILVCDGIWWNLRECLKAVRYLKSQPELSLIFHRSVKMSGIRLPAEIRAKPCFVMPYFPDPFLPDRLAYSFFQQLMDSVQKKKRGRMPRKLEILLRLFTKVSKKSISVIQKTISEPSEY